MAICLINKRDDNHRHTASNQDITTITATIKPQTGDRVRNKAVLTKSPWDTVTPNGRRPGVLAVM